MRIIIVKLLLIGFVLALTGCGFGDDKGSASSTGKGDDGTIRVTVTGAPEDEMFGVIATVGVKYAGATGYILFESSGEISTLIKEPSSTQGNSKIPQIFTGGDTVKLHISVGSFDKEIDIVVDGNMTVDLNYNDLKAE